MSGYSFILEYNQSNAPLRKSLFESQLPAGHFEVVFETGSVFCRSAPWECFGDPTVSTWRHVHHIGVPAKTMKRQPCWCPKPILRAEFFSYAKKFLLSQQMCIAADHVSENTPLAIPRLHTKLGQNYSTKQHHGAKRQHLLSLKNSLIRL